MGNVWKATIVNTTDKTEQKLVLKGASSAASATKAAERIAAAQRNRVIRDWGADKAPILIVKDVTDAGNDESAPGAFRPANVKPIDLDKFTKQTSKQLGHGGERPSVDDNAIAKSRKKLTP